MARNRETKIELTAYDDLFQTDESRAEAALSKIRDIPLSEIDEFPDHPFKVLMDEDMEQLVESVKRNGVMTPATVRLKEDGRYELISGHRRKKACELAGLETLKCEVKDLTRDEAIIIMVESNLQRSVILPSEKAFAYKMRLEAMKRQGQRSDLTSSPLATKLQSGRSDTELGELVGESKDQIRRFIRLTELVPEILQMVDEKQIAFRPAVEISYLAEEQQSVRTIYRDIDALSGAGIPIYAEAGRNGGIYLMNDFVMDKAVLTEEEKREILTALHSINSTSNIDNSQILQKLSAIFNVGSESWLEVDFSRWGNNGTDNAKFELLKSAVIQQRCVKITYANSYGTISERIIQPLKVLYKSMSWYLKAYCTEKQDYRIFKLTRIITLEMLSDTFDKKSFPELDEMSGQVYSTIVLRFAKEISYRVYDEFDNTQISTEENGDLIVSVEMPEDEWLIGYLLSFGTQVDIVEPAHLKDIVAKQAKSIYEKYKS